MYECLLIGILIVSTAGMICFVKQTAGIPIAFCPAVALAGQTLWLYITALADMLIIGVYTVTVFGLISFVWCMLWHSKTYAEFLKPAMMFFLLYGSFCAVINHDIVLLGFDNFSHWAVAAKELYITNALPSADTMVTFTNYPPATALYEYFVLQFLGLQESYMVLALNFLAGSMLSCCFVGIEWHMWTELFFRLAVVLGIVMILPTNYQNLQVDAVLGFTQLAMSIIALWDVTFSKRIIIPQAVLGTLLILIKMSGMFLLFIHIALLILLQYKRRTRGNRLYTVCRYIAPVVIFPAMASLFFSKYVQYTFGAAVADNQFQISYTSYTSQLLGKSDDFWDTFPQAFLHSFVDISNSSIVFFILCNSCLLVIFILLTFCRNTIVGSAKILILFSWGSMLLYILCLLGMYVFMMGEEESIVVASFNRYIGTGVIYQVGLSYIGPRIRAGSNTIVEDRLPIWISLVCLGSLILPIRNACMPVTGWNAEVRSSHSAIENQVFPAYNAIQDIVDENCELIYVATDYSKASPEFIYRVLRYSFWRSYVWPLADDFFDTAYFEEENSCYILWLDSDSWIQNIFDLYNIEPPKTAGLYWKNKSNQLVWLADVTD